MMNPAVSNMQTMHQKYSSVGSVYSMASMGYLPPGHGYVPRKIKPDKPYGLSFLTRMNRTSRGPGEKYLRYAAVCAGFALLFFLGAALYFGHRNVSRMIVLRTEVLGALMIVIGIILVSVMGKLIFKARVESNRWRYYVRFRPEGLNTAAATNTEVFPETRVTMTLQSGTYGKKALREIPKPKHMKKKYKAKSGSKASLLGTPSQSQQFIYPPPQQTSSPAATLQQPSRKAPSYLPYEPEALPKGQPYQGHPYPGQPFPVQGPALPGSRSKPYPAQGQPYPGQQQPYPSSQGPPQYQQYPMEEMAARPTHPYNVRGVPTDESAL